MEYLLKIGNRLVSKLGLTVLALAIVAVVFATVAGPVAGGPRRAPVQGPGLPSHRDVRHARDPALLRFSRRLHSRRDRAALRAARLPPGRLQDHRVLQLHSADLGAGGGEPRPRRDPRLRLHGRDDGAQRHRQRPALLRAGAVETRARGACARRHDHGHDPRGDDRNHRRVRHDDDGACPAHDDQAGLQPWACVRHDSGLRHAGHPHSAQHHADHHGRPALGLGRQPVHGGAGSRADPGGLLSAVRGRHFLDQAGDGAPACARIAHDPEGGDGPAPLTQLPAAGVPDRD